MGATFKNEKIFKLIKNLHYTLCYLVFETTEKQHYIKKKVYRHIKKAWAIRTISNVYTKIIKKNSKNNI